MNKVIDWQSMSVCKASTNCASEESSRSSGFWPLNPGPAGSSAANITLENISRAWNSVLNTTLENRMLTSLKYSDNTQDERLSQLTFIAVSFSHFFPHIFFSMWQFFQAVLNQMFSVSLQRISVIFERHLSSGILPKPCRFFHGDSNPGKTRSMVCSFDATTQPWQITHCLYTLQLLLNPLATVALSPFAISDF